MRARHGRPFAVALSTACLLLPALLGGSAAAQGTLPTLAPLVEDAERATATETTEYGATLAQDQVLFAIALARASGVPFLVDEVAEIETATTAATQAMDAGALPAENAFAALALGVGVQPVAGPAIVNERVTAATTVTAALPRALTPERTLAGLILYANGYEYDPHLLQAVDDVVVAAPTSTVASGIPLQSAFAASALGVRELPMPAIDAVRDVTLRAPSSSAVLVEPALSLDTAIAAVILGRYGESPEPELLISKVFTEEGEVGAEVEVRVPRSDTLAALVLGGGPR